MCRKKLTNFHQVLVSIFCWNGRISEVYLRFCPTFTMELFWENREQLKAAFCFHQETPSQMLVRVPNTPLLFRELWVTVLAILWKPNINCSKICQFFTAYWPVKQQLLVLWKTTFPPDSMCIYNETKIFICGYTESNTILAMLLP